jgi:hypothetical protein
MERLESLAVSLEGQDFVLDWTKETGDGWTPIITSIE